MFYFLCNDARHVHVMYDCMVNVGEQSSSCVATAEFMQCFLLPACCVNAVNATTPCRLPAGLPLQLITPHELAKRLPPRPYLTRQGATSDKQRCAHAEEREA